MKSGIIKKLTFSTLFLFLAFFSTALFAQTYLHDYTDGEVYIKFRDDIQVNIPVNDDLSVDLDKAPFLNALREKFDITGLSRPFYLNNDPKLLRTYEISFSAFDQLEEIKAELTKNTDLEYVENVPLYRISYIPNDSLYNLEMGYANWNWHLDVINAVQAWDITKGSPDIKVAIVDNAVWVDHPDLENKVVLSEDVTQPGIQNSNPPANGDPALWSHGTHCAGLVAAQSDNTLGVASIGFNVSIIGVKASSSNPENISGGFAGVQWAANNGADVISMSWGGAGYSASDQNLINTIYNMGIVLVGAAGNDNVNTPHYPSGYNHVIGVASTNEDDVKTDFSNYGPKVDVCAPGGYGVNGPDGLMSSTVELTSYGYYNAYAGTSMACPVTSGLCGLILSINPDLDPDQVESVLKSSCDFIDDVPGNENYAGLLGSGRINAYEAVSSTPFSPLADFYTDVPYITPGTSIQYYDNSAGVPDSWSWEFTGGQPHLSSQQNPSVTYLAEGVYTVYLGVSNDFGEDVETKTNYITVTNTPLPWIVYSASETLICSNDTVIFVDESLYGPTAWNWEFTPSTVVFVDGTTANSQHPHVLFTAPGNYTVKLTATNANGSNSRITENMIHADGVAVNFEEDFETGASTGVILSNNSRARVKIDARAAAPGSTKGLHFQGSTLTGGWSGGPVNTTPEQAWNTNVNFQGFADICNVDATGIAGVKLVLDLRQTYSIGNKYSWFRVLVNGLPVNDIDGVINFNPATNTDPFDTKIFDLSGYGNTQFSLKLQSSCYLSDKFFAEGDNVFVDNLMITNNTSVTDGIDAAGVLTYPNPANDVLNYSVSGAGEKITVKVLNMQGQVMKSETTGNYREGSVRQINTADLTDGMYILSISGEKGTTVKKFVKE